MNAMMKPMPQMIRYDAACKALAEAKAVDEVQDIRNKADAMRIYGMQAKNKTLEIDAAEIRIRAERKLGELLIQQKADTGLNTGNQFKHAAVPTGNRREIPTLAEAGIDKKLSSRAQKLAAVPHAEFEAEVKEWKGRVDAEGERVTTRLERAGERAQGKTKPAKNAPTIESLQAENEALRDELDEALDNCRTLADGLTAYEKASEGVEAAAAEIKLLNDKLRVAYSRCDTMMVTDGELKKQIASQTRQISALNKKLSASK
jgi:hypothetical protein